VSSLSPYQIHQDSSQWPSYSGHCFPEHARRKCCAQYAALLGVDLHAKDIIAEALGINEEAIVEFYVQRRLQQSAEASPEDHVKAPPDLIDDDAADSQSNDRSLTSSQPDTPKKPPEPVDENGKPLDVSDIRYVRALREGNLAQQKKNQGDL
jgi:hypothetical protein